MKILQQWKKLKLFWALSFEFFKSLFLKSNYLSKNFERFLLIFKFLKIESFQI